MSLDKLVKNIERRKNELTEEHVETLVRVVDAYDARRA